MLRFLQRPALLGLFLLPLGLYAQKINPDHLKGIKVRSIGPAAMSGRITALTAAPNNQEVIYAGAASGGLWRSKGGGTGWEPIFDKAPTQSIGSVVVSPRNPDEIWVGTGEGNPRNSQNFGVGIFRTIDGGKTWNCMGLEKTRSIHRVLLHRDDPNIIFAAASGSATGPNEERGVFKSADGGKTWRKVLYVNDLTGCAELIADPSNPNKLFAAMWEYRRWPWFFKSGGKGSGLYVTYDAGETWKRLSEKEGLPEGELGRIGLAIPACKPEVVYALVEAKENALYKSTDGGRNWRKMATKGMGDRPFYYSEIYADPKNENRLYSIHTVITRSEDGGKTFDTWAGWRIHPDHHAFWISPNDPNYIVNGNDGGLNITRDGGKTWRFADNLPVGQFYHINLDNEMPYNIYGGLQDNGSWVGPSSVWKAGGIRNSDWQEVLFGDGFDAMPRADDARYCFAQSQGGYLSYVDRKTGFSQGVQPMHPEGKNLRFNWNSGLAQDPFRPHGIYFGSQHLHYSSDLGQSWSIISPDLTTNDTSKMHQNTSGGLTMDATNAENHCTIIAVAPSPAQQGVVWAGTDDGNVQLTRDGGKTWENCTPRLPECPQKAWVPHIDVSAKNAGEALVVVNNYRQNDWQPYLYHTKDFGKTWRRLANANNVTGFCLSAAQDLEVPNLLFLGTDQGLYVSFDYGDTWMHWTNETFPNVPVQDLKIHPRDGDLVIGTFGRAVWIMDNIRPLRELARAGAAATLDKPFRVFAPQDAVLAEYRSFDGARFAADETFKGENKSTAAVIPVWVKPASLKAKTETPPTADPGKGDKDKGKKAGDKTKPAEPAEPAAKPEEKKADAPKTDKKDSKPSDDKKKDKATVVVRSMNGDTLRRFKAELDTTISYVFWNLDTKGVRFPSNNEPDKDALEPGGGPQVGPGTYKITLKFGDQVDSTTVRVIGDPRLPISDSDRAAKTAAIRDMYQYVEKATKAYSRLKDAEKTIKLVEDQFVNVPDSVKKEVLKLGKTLQDSIGAIKAGFFMQKEPKGIERDPNNVNAYLFKALGYIGDGMGAPNATAQIAIREAKQEVDKLVARVNGLFEKDWKAYREKAESIKYSLFKE